MSSPRFVVIGMGGYGLAHIEAVEWLESRDLAVLTGVVALEEDRENHPELIASLREKQVSLYETIEHFLEKGAETADVVTVAVGIHMHVPVSISLMEAGFHVYCEKPVAGTVDEVDRLIEVRNRTGKKIAIGFQYIYSHSIQRLKQAIVTGRLGRVKSCSILCGWPRSIDYFSRNNWAGKLKIDEAWVFDSPANNAHAHFLMNMLYLASPDPGRTAVPTELTAELYRANPIESADLVQLKFVTDSHVGCFATLAHSNWTVIEPLMRIDCDDTVVTWETDNGKTRISYGNGRAEYFDNLIDEQWRFNGFKDIIEAVREDRDPICAPETARPHAVTVAMMHEACPDIHQIPEDFITELDDADMYPPHIRARFRRINRLDEYMKAAFEGKKLFSEMGIPWAMKEH